MNIVLHISYFAGIMLNPFSDPFMLKIMLAYRQVPNIQQQLLHR